MRILVIDDELKVRDSVKRLLEMLGHDVVVASTGGEALIAARDLEFDAYLCDYDLAGGATGVEVLTDLRAMTSHPSKTPFVLMSGLVRENVPPWITFFLKDNLPWIIDAVVGES